MMRKWNNDDLFYVCSMIEFVARKTHNQPKDIVAKLSDKELAHQLKAAGVNHCLSFEQICDEWIEEYGIEEGTFDNISTPFVPTRRSPTPSVRPKPIHS